MSAPAVGYEALGSQEVTHEADCHSLDPGTSMECRGRHPSHTSRPCPGLGCHLRAHGADVQQKTRVNEVARKISHCEGEVLLPLLGLKASPL